jgi:hypothetical protein
MNTTTEARQDISGSTMTSSAAEQGAAKPSKPGLAQLWTAIAALGAVVAIVVAVALASDSSSSDSQNPSVAEPTSAAVEGFDSDVHREINQQASKADAGAHYQNGGLDPETRSEVFEQVYGDEAPTDPSDDTDLRRVGPQ